MVTGLAIILSAAAALGGGRDSRLDSLAASLLELDHIPSGADLLHLSSRTGWVWPLGGVEISNRSGSSPSDSVSWGMGESGSGHCIVTAPVPLVSLEHPLPYSVLPGDPVPFYPETALSGLRGGAITPGLEVVPLEPGVQVFRQEGTWWLELMADTDYGPQVILLTPMVVGKPGQWPGNRWEPHEIAPGLNSLRRKFSLQALVSSPFLNLLAGIRARQSLGWGGAFHSSPECPGTIAAMPGSFGAWAENIALGADAGEAAQMMLLSPFHFASSVDDRYGFMGIGLASSARGTTLVILLTESGPEGLR